MSQRLSANNLKIERVATPVRNQVVEVLRNAIYDMKFEPGEKLIERELCDALDVSRTALREGLRQLESEGLIDVIPNRGPAISKMTKRQAAELYELRALLEGELAVQALRKATKTDLQKLGAIVKALANVLSKRDRVNLIAEKRKFYVHLMGIADNQELTNMLMRIYGRFSLLWPTMAIMSGNNPEQIIDEVNVILDAMQQRDEAATRAAFAVHMENASSQTQKYMQEAGWD